jgi:hypothetical protein
MYPNIFEMNFSDTFFAAFMKRVSVYKTLKKAKYCNVLFEN